MEVTVEQEPTLVKSELFCLPLVESRVYLQSELEDLCFAVMHPGCYRKLHTERNELWKRNVVSPSVAAEADRVLGSYDAATLPAPALAECGAAPSQQVR